MLISFLSLINKEQKYIKFLRSRCARKADKYRLLYWHYSFLLGESSSILDPPSTPDKIK